MGRRLACLVLAVWLALTGSVPAQQAESSPGNAVRSAVLVIDSDAVYRASAFGQRIQRETAAEGRALAAENRRIEDELEGEEQELTARRATLEPAEFRDLADAFDAKVRSVRQSQDAKARIIARRQEEARRDFLTAAAPVLEAMMLEAGAAVVLERREIFLSLNAIDITRDAIQRIDAEIGDGVDDPETE